MVKRGDKFRTLLRCTSTNQISKNSGRYRVSVRPYDNLNVSSDTMQRVCLLLMEGWFHER